jgi:hypothetical protein
VTVAFIASPARGTGTEADPDRATAAAVRSGVLGLVEQARAAADPGFGQHQLDPGGGLVVPGQRRGDRADLLVAERSRPRRPPSTLVHRQVCAADEAGLWTLQTSIFPENRASIALHHPAGYRTLGVRERISRHHDTWRDTVFLERRRAT